MNPLKQISKGITEFFTGKSYFDGPPSAYVEREGNSWEWTPSDEFMQKFFKHAEGCTSYSDEQLITLFHQVPEIFAPIHEIASRVSDAVWELRKWNNDQTIWDDKDFNRLFSTPNPTRSFKKFIYEAVCYEIVTGKQFFYFNIPDSLAFDWRNIAAWWNLPAHKVIVQTPKRVKLYSATELSDIVTNYVIYYPDGSKDEFLPHKVLPIQQINLAYNGKVMDGKSPLQSAEKAIRNLVAVYAARYNIYDKRGMLGVFFSKKEDQTGGVALTKSEKQKALADINGTYGITKNRMPYALTDMPIGFVQTNMSIADLQPFDETLADAVAIYKTLRVPRHLVPSKDNSTFANAESDMRSFYQDVIIPIANQYAEAFTNYFRLNDGIADSRLKRYIVPSFEHIDVLQENKKEKADVDKINGDVYEKRFLHGVCTLNEWIIATGGEKATNPIYDKLFLDMSPEEQEQIKAMLAMKKPAQPGQQLAEDEEDQNTTQQPTLQVA